MAVATLCLSIAPPEAVADSLWNGTAQPANSILWFPVELGVQFEVSQAGQIQAVSFYKAPEDNATSHQVHLWSSSGQLLATGQTSNESASGWQTATFSSPVNIQANTIYVASYFSSAGAFVFNDNFFETALTVGSITAPSTNQVARGNGVYIQSSASSFPLDAFNARNYWVDIQFEPSGPVPESLWNGGASPAENILWLPVELGLQFQVSQAGDIQGISFYKSTVDTQSTHEVHLWSSSGQLLATGQTLRESASGWQTARFSSPVSIQANTIYLASYFSPTGAFAYTDSYFTSALTVGSITAPSTTQVAPGNGVFTQLSASSFPSDSFNARNYWVDVQFEPGAPTATTPGQFLPGWASSYTPKTEIYVSPSGNDSNDGLSRATALQTTNAARSRLAPGVRLNFTAGTYDCGTSFISNLFGGTAQPASIRSVDGPHLATFNCGGRGGFLLDNVQGFIFEGIEVTNTSGSHGIQIATSHQNIPNNLSSDIVIHNCYIHDVGLADVKGGQSKNITLISNTLGTTGSGRQNAEFVAVDNVILAGNEGYGAHGFDEIKGGAHGGIIFGNYVHDSGLGIFVGGPATSTQFLVDPTVDFEAENVQVWNNLITNVNDGAFRIVGCHNCTVANNTFWAPTPHAAFRLLVSHFNFPDGSFSPAINNVNTTIVNNIFASGTSFTILVAASANQTTGLVVQNNLWWAPARGTVVGIFSDIPVTGDPNSIYAQNPDLISPPTNLQPAPGSPVFGRGIPVSFVTGNYLGVPWNGNPNMGAF